MTCLDRLAQKLTELMTRERCKFWDNCQNWGLHPQNCYTCLHGGGSYCGRYRKLEAAR